MKIGIWELLKSKKGTLSLLILATSTVAVMTKHIDGMSYAAIMSSVAVIYNFCQHRIDMLPSNATIGTPDAPISIMGRNP